MSPNKHKNITELADLFKIGYFSPILSRPPTRECTVGDVKPHDENFCAKVKRKDSFKHI
jgi:hypothetical protein